MMSSCDAPRDPPSPIDRLESFHPGSRCHYRCVLVPASVENIRRLAWVCVVENLGISRRRTASGRWPE